MAEISDGSPATDVVVTDDHYTVTETLGGTNAATNIGDTESHSYNRAQGLSDSGAVVGFAWNLFQPNDSIAYDGGWKTIGGIDGPRGRRAQHQHGDTKGNAGGLSHRSRPQPSPRAALSVSRRGW